MMLKNKMNNVSYVFTLLLRTNQLLLKTPNN